MDKFALQARTKEFAVRVLKLVEHLPHSVAGRAIGNQIVRSATSVGANYRAACRARSKAEFIAKLGIVVEEADETLYWLELIVAAGLLIPRKVSLLLKEANELTAIFSSARYTSARRVQGAAPKS
ncbi:MAG TPA: four helix bundle protein [Chthoniobacter sp.]|nr:four helix bundle protein [Chthoniobacter sp.]